MDFKELVLRSVRITWAHKWLWVFGFFGGGASVMPNFNSFTWQEPGSFDSFKPEMERWVTQNWELIMAFLVFLVFAAVIFGALNIISQGALISAADSFDQEKETSFGAAFSAGLSAFWSLAGLFLLVALIVMAPIVVLAVPVVLATVLAISTGNIALIVGVVVFALLLVLAFIPVMIAAGIITTFGTRNILLHGQKAVAALRSGWQLFRENIGQSLMIWLIGLVLTIAFSFMFFIVALVMLIPVAIAGFFIYQAGVNLLNIGIVAFLGLLLLSVMITVVSAFRAMTSVYWTLAYQELTAEPDATGDDADNGLASNNPAPAGA